MRYCRAAIHAKPRVWMKLCPTVDAVMRRQDSRQSAYSFKPLVPRPLNAQASLRKLIKLCTLDAVPNKRTCHIRPCTCWRYLTRLLGSGIVLYANVSKMKRRAVLLFEKFENLSTELIAVVDHPIDALVAQTAVFAQQTVNAVAVAGRYCVE